MDNIINYLIEGRGEWKYYPGSSILTSFNQAIMFSEEKMWIQCLCMHIVPTLKVYNVNNFRAILIFAIFQKKQVCIGK